MFEKYYWNISVNEGEDVSIVDKFGGTDLKVRTEIDKEVDNNVLIISIGVLEEKCIVDVECVGVFDGDWDDEDNYDGHLDGDDDDVEDDDDKDDTVRDDDKVIEWEAVMYIDED